MTFGSVSKQEWLGDHTGFVVRSQGNMSAMMSGIERIE